MKQQNKTRFFKTSDQESMPPTESDADDNSMEWLNRLTAW